jgi:cell division protein FtsW (lipid II flippase)
MGMGRYGIPSPKHFGPLLVIWGGAMLVLFQTNDLGGGLLYFSIFLAMLYLATARWPYVAVGLALFAVGAWILFQIGPAHLGNRISIWLDCSWGMSASCDVFRDGYQLPYLATDFVYAAIVQELGLAGAAALILLYVVFLYRGFHIALLADDGFSKLLAAGLTATLAIQAFIIMGGVTGLIPLTGITLPFVSYGGSSIVANFLLLALLLMVSNHVNRERL